MKRLAVLALSANALFAADFLTGQAARAVLGQVQFTSQDTQPSQATLGAASGLAYANGMLFVADANRMGALPQAHRVLIYNNIGQELPAAAVEVPQGPRCPVCGGTADVVLGQADFSKTDPTLTQSGLNLPTAVATDGTRLVVADTNNNRILIWNTIPHANNVPADVVLGQENFTTALPNAGTGDSRVPSARSLRGPQGVWLQGGKLYVADTQNNRVLVWNSVPTQNFTPADFELGQPNLNTVIEPDLTKSNADATAKNLLNPVAVSSDGVRLFVTDLGHNRVLIWSTLPTQNEVPADLVIGQPDLTSNTANNSSTVTSRDSTTGAVTGRKGVLCASNGKDSNNVDTFPNLCGATLSFPRFALSDGTRLFIADGGNDRVLIFDSFPTANGASANAVLGQISDTIVQTSDSSGNPDAVRRSSADAVRTPSSLAWDGANLYVSEPFSRRVVVFTEASSPALTPVRNAASMNVFAVGAITVSGTIKEGDQVQVKVNDKTYSYTVKKADTLDTVASGIADAINAGTGDPNVLATPIPSVAQVRLTSRAPGDGGNSIKVTSSTVNSSASIQVAGATMSGGGSAAELGPGTLITIFGQGMTDQPAAAAPGDADPLPTELAGIQVYADGRRLPLLYAGPSQINAQLPFEVSDSNSSSLYVRTKHSDGTVTVSNAVGVPVITANPGIFALGGSDPRPAVVVHSSSSATGTVMIDGTAKENDKVSITIHGRVYSYTVKSGDTLDTIRDYFVNTINSQDPEVAAFPGGEWDRVRLHARVNGPAGNGIPYSAKNDSGGNVVMTVSNGKLTGANTAGALVTTDNPAMPGETITVYATGLGVVQPDAAMAKVGTGKKYNGPYLNKPTEFLSSIAGGKTANVLYDGLLPGNVGIYQVDLELNPDLPTNPATQLTIAQDVYVSNIVTFAVKKP